MIKKVLIPALFCAATLSVNGAAIHSGLLSYWNFEGNFDDSAGTISGNASAFVDNGTAGSAVTIAGSGQLGSYGNFARTGLGTDNVVAVNDSADLDAQGESITISAWFRVGNFDQNWQALIAHGEASDWRIARRGDGNELGYAGGTGDIPNPATALNINDGAWHNIVAITESGVSTRLWVDGSLVGTSGGAPNISDNGAAQMFIGGNPQGDAGATNANQYRPWNGDIDDVGLWNRALSPAEVTEIYNSGAAGISLGNIPEPSTGILGALAGLALVFNRRRR